MDSLTFYYVLAGAVVLVYGWKKMQSRGIAQYTPGEARERVSAGSVLLDVRTAAERKQSSIAGSLHIPLHELSAKIKTLEKHKTREVILYCASGSRSSSAAVQLKKAGFTVGNLKGGIGAWKFANL
jgi:rhodanese-related sulfurtransferase